MIENGRRTGRMGETHRGILVGGTAKKMTGIHTRSAHIFGKCTSPSAKAALELLMQMKSIKGMLD